MTQEQLQKTIDSCKQGIDFVDKAILQRQGEKINLEATLYKAEKELQEYTKNPPSLQVSDHAMVRYIERQTGISIEDLKKELITHELESLVKKTINGVFTVKGIEYRIVNRIIVTII